MQAGLLRHFVELQRRAPTQDATGDPIGEWQLVGRVWAQIVPVSGREFAANQAVANQVTARIVIRYRAGVEPKMRIVHRGTNYNIEAVLPDPKSGREYLTLPVSTGLNEG